MVLLTDPRNFCEKSVCVGVHNTELMERGVVLLMERGVCGRVTRRQDGVVLLTDPRNFRDKSERPRSGTE